MTILVIDEDILMQNHITHLNNKKNVCSCYSVDLKLNRKGLTNANAIGIYSGINISNCAFLPRE